MKKEKTKIDFDNLISESEQNKKASKIKRFAKWFALNAILVPSFINSFKSIKSIIKNSFPASKIETYEEAIKRNGFTDEDIQRGYNQHKIFRNVFGTLSFLTLSYTLIFVEGKVETVIYLLGLFNFLILTLKHDLRVWQIENKKLCKFNYYLIQRFFNFKKEKKWK